MGRYKVAIEETCVQEFEVEAEDSILALGIAESKYKNGAFALEPGEIQFRQMAVVSPSNESTEWIEF